VDLLDPPPFHEDSWWNEMKLKISVAARLRGFLFEKIKKLEIS
jgi:hypothetical protein